MTSIERFPYMFIIIKVLPYIVVIGLFLFIFIKLKKLYDKFMKKSDKPSKQSPPKPVKLPPTNNMPKQEPPANINQNVSPEPPANQPTPNPENNQNKKD